LKGKSFKKTGDAALKAAGNELPAQSRFNLQPSLCLARWKSVLKNHFA
jgi:hypothetical protein